MSADNNHIPEITVTELAHWYEQNRSFLLIDVRKQSERLVCNIDGSWHVPMDQIMSIELPTDKPVVIFCHAGVRSAMVVYQLRQLGYENVLNLAGGIVAWLRTCSKPIE